MPFATSVDYRIPTLRKQKWGAAIDNYVPLDLSDQRWPMTNLESVQIGCPTLTARPEYPCQLLQWNTPEGFQSTSTFKPFRIEESITCSTIGAWSPDELEQWAREEARAVVSAALARQVWGGLYTVGATTLSANAVEVTNPAGTSPTDALAAVEYALGQRLFGQGMVHMTTDMLVRSKGNLVQDGDQWLTPTGNIVVADHGYYVSGQPYIYGSGIVGYELTDFDVQTGLVQAHNDLVVYVQAWAIVEFESCPLVKAAVTGGTPANYGGV